MHALPVSRGHYCSLLKASIGVADLSPKLYAWTAIQDLGRYCLVCQLLEHTGKHTLSMSHHRTEVIHMIFSWMLCRLYIFQFRGGLAGQVKSKSFYRCVPPLFCAECLCQGRVWGSRSK